jgi:hypothetical protein
VKKRKTLRVVTNLKNEKMKKIFGVLLAIISIALSIGFLYLVYKTWEIFGIWNMIWTGVVTLFSALFLAQLFGSREEKDGVITYNPKEWPKFINMLVSLVVGYYLYTVLLSKEVSKFDYGFGIAYLILFTAVPILFAIYKLIRDRNDYISVGQTNLTYRDNSESGDFKFSDIANIEVVGGIKLTFKDSSAVTIKTAKMNFNAKDLISAFNDIKAKLPE